MKLSLLDNKMMMKMHTRGWSLLAPAIFGLSGPLELWFDNLLSLIDEYSKADGKIYIDDRAPLS